MTDATHAPDPSAGTAAPPHEADGAPGEMRPFQADVARLLHLLVHSVYSTPDVFLRELVSNAADACEKLRQAALTAPELMGDDARLSIAITVDPAHKRLTIADNGIGMSREELIDNLGTMARSGTERFRAALEDRQSSDALIGQFGVGFYSAFMVADRVRVTSRPSEGGAAHSWESDGDGAFTVSEIADHPRGTVVTLSLKAQHEEYADEATIERLVKHHSAHVPVPVSIEAAGADARREVVDGTALWTRPKAEIGEDEYTEFYRFVAGAFDTPALTIHARVEGRQEYTTLLFVPEAAPFDLFDPDRKGRVKLYVRRVFITDDAPVLPAYLRFVRGLVDSQDLPLNLSREMLQTNPMLAQIKTAVTKRVLSELDKLAERSPETYAKVWESFGSVLKEGLYEDAERRDALFRLARFETTAGEQRTLKDYVAEMKENQTAIYYAVGEDRERIRSSPHLEGFAARGVEVLILSDPVDAFWVRGALGYEGKPFKSVTQGTADLDGIALQETEAAADVPSEARASDVATLVALMKQTLGDKVSDVRASPRLATSPACLVAPEHGYDRTMERMVARHGQAGFGVKPILEVNPKHPLVQRLSERAATGGAVERVADAAILLFGLAEIAEGEAPSDPAGFNARLVHAMTLMADGGSTTGEAGTIALEGGDAGTASSGGADAA